MVTLQRFGGTRAVRQGSQSVARLASIGPLRHFHRRIARRDEEVIADASEPREMRINQPRDVRRALQAVP